MNTNRINEMTQAIVENCFAISQDFDEIKEVGYRHGDTYFKGFKKAGLMRQFYWAKPRQLSRRGSVFTLNKARRGSLYDVSNIGSQGSSLESSGKGIR